MAIIKPPVAVSFFSRLSAGDAGLFALSRAPRNPWRHLDRPAGRAGRGGRPRRGDRARGRDADDHAQRAAGRQPARLSRSVRARPARAVRLRPSGALRGADAARASPHALGLDEPAERRCGGAAFLRDAAAALLDTLRRATGPSARAPGRRRSRSPGCAGRGRRRVAAAAAPARSATSAGCSRACPNGRRARRRAAAAHRSGSTDAETSDAARRADRRRRRDARGPARLCRGRGRGLRAARTTRTQPNLLLAEAGHRDRQDARLSRPGLALGRAGRRRGLGLDLSPRRCSASSTARARGSSPTPAERTAQDRDPQGPRELSLPAQPRGRAAGRLRRPRGDPRAAGRALGGL